MKTHFLDRPYGRMAYHQIEGENPGLVFLHGFKSDKDGSKAVYLQELAAQSGLSYCAIDCMMHGESDGDEMEFTLSTALDDVLITLDQLVSGPQILIGSSMGGWLALRAAEERPQAVAGLIGIAPAPDFTAEIAARLSDEQVAQMATQGYVSKDSGYEDPYIFTRKLIEDGAEHLMLHRPIKYDGAVHILQGQQDTAVPWEKAQRIADALTSNNVEITLVPDGDHSLSRPQDLEKLGQAIQKIGH